MFFKEQSLYEAKKATLLAGVQLINQRAKAMNTVLTLMKDELKGIDAELDIIKNEKSILPENKEARSKKIHLLIERKVLLKSNVMLVSSCYIKFLEGTRRELLSDRNSSYRVYVVDPFAEDALLNAPAQKSLDYPYFSSSEFLLISENALNAAQAREDQMILLRFNLTGAFFVAAATAALVAGFAGGLAIGVLVNPVLGAAIILLASVAYAWYSLYHLENDMNVAMQRCTQITGKIDVGASNPDLFCELDKLIAAHKPQPEEDASLNSKMPSSV